MKTKSLSLAVTALLTLGLTAQADVLYGIQRGGVSTAGGGDVLRIDIEADGTSLTTTVLGNTLDTYDPDDFFTGSNPWVYNYPNGFFYDLANMRLYYSIPQDASGVQNGPSTLYYYDLDPDSPDFQSSIEVGDVTANASNGTFRNGKYYYIAHLDDDLHIVTLKPDGYAEGDGIDSEDVIPDLTGNTWRLAFGDMDIDGSGMVYGSAGGFQTSFGYIYFTFDLADPAGTFVETTYADKPTSPQLALGCADRIWANDTGGPTPGTYYLVDPANGQLTPMYADGPLLNDLASGECEPDRTIIPLCAGQHTEIGVIIVESTDQGICITYETYDEWFLYETHLSVQLDPQDFPMTGSGNPRVGHFEDGDDPLPTGTQSVTYCYTTEELQEKFGVEDISVLYIAPHAAVSFDETAWPCLDGDVVGQFPGRNWATYFMFQF